MPGRILIVDDDRGMCEMIEADLRLRGFEAAWTTVPSEAIAEDQDRAYHVVLTDLKMPEMSGTELCERIVANRPDVPVVVMTAFGSMETAVAAIRAGAYDFVTKPVELDMLALTLERAVRHHQLQEKVKLLSEEVKHLKRFDEMLGTSPPMQELFDQLSRIADTRSLGPGHRGKRYRQGTGGPSDSQQEPTREPAVRARQLCRPARQPAGKRTVWPRQGRLHRCPCGRKGLFLEAEGGTLFLDEIGDFRSPRRPNCLRALEEQKLRPVGGNREIGFDVRILSATNRDLETAVEENRFREDLFFRINVIQLDVPPLRARGTDILLLAQHFVEMFAAPFAKVVTGLSNPVAEKLLAYSWPETCVNCATSSNGRWR